MIDIGRVHHAVTRDVDNEIALRKERGDVISNEVAAAIAGWFASPHPQDAPFTLLAQRGRVDTGALGEAILRELEMAKAQGNTSVQDYLEALDEWTAQLEEVPA